MGKIIKEIGLLGSKDNFIRLNALFDTGATINVIKKRFDNGGSIDDIGIIEYLGWGQLILANGMDIKAQKIKLKLLKLLGAGNKDPIKEPEFFLLDELIYDVIIGAKLMQQLGIILNPSKKEISFCAI